MANKSSRASRDRGSRGRATTSPAVASKAAKVLGDEGATADERSVAASALSQAAHEAEARDAGIDDPQAMIEGLETTNVELRQRLSEEVEIREQLETANASLQTEIARLQDEWEGENRLARAHEDNFKAARAEVERLKQAEQPSVDIAALRAEVERLRDQVRWYEERKKG